MSNNQEVKKAILLLFIFILRDTAVMAQRGGIVFTRMTRENGLASSRVTTILKDHQGYYWIGSANGLQRFDGKRMVNFQHDPKDPSSIPDNLVLQLKEDNKKRLWLNIAGIPYIYDPDRRSFKKIPVDHGGPEALNITAFIQDETGLFWITVSGGDPFIFDSVNNVFKPYTSIWPAAPAQIMDIVYENKRGYYWVVTLEGMMIYDPKKKEYYNRDHNPKRLRCFTDSTFLYPTGPVYKDPNDVLWAQFWGTNGGWGHYWYDIKKDELIRFNLNYHLWGYMTDHLGATWCYGDSLAYFDNKSGKFIRVLPKKNSLYGIDFNEIYHMFEDEENNIWAVTNLGLYFFNLQRQYFNTTDAIWTYKGKTFMDGNTTGFIETNDGHVISLSWGADGLNFFDTTFTRVPPLYGFNPNDFKDPDYLFT